MVLPDKDGECRICGRKGSTDWHHIISQSHAIKSNQEELITNSGNVVELCRICHNQTTASMVRKRLKRFGTDEDRYAGKKLVEHRTESLKLLEERGVLAKGNIPKNQWKGSGEWLDMEIEQLFPPDHWLHDKEQYDPELSLRFEAQGWVWATAGGARFEHHRIMKERQEESLELLEKRGVLARGSSSNKKWKRKLHPSRKEDREWLDVEIEQLFPPDHWLHDGEQYDPELSLRFEAQGWLWARNGGARMENR
jgi:hypothetical protein